MAEARAESGDREPEVWIGQVRLSRMHPALSGGFLGTLRHTGALRWRQDRNQFQYLLSGGPGSVEEWLAERRGHLRPPMT
jgi:hypothetical protein